PSTATRIAVTRPTCGGSWSRSAREGSWSAGTSRPRCTACTIASRSRLGSPRITCRARPPVGLRRAGSPPPAPPAPPPPPPAGPRVRGGGVARGGGVSAHGNPPAAGARAAAVDPPPAPRFPPFARTRLFRGRRRGAAHQAVALLAEPVAPALRVQPRRQPVPH